jgi:hypothetical protein
MKFPLYVMHAIEKIDLALGTVQREASQPISWHGLETPFEGLTTDNCALSQLETKRGKITVSFDGDEYPSPLIVPAIVHPFEFIKDAEGKDTEKRAMHFLAAPYAPETYELFDAREFCAFAKDCFTAAGLDNGVSFVSTLFSGSRMILSRELPEAGFEDAHGHKVKTYINLLNSVNKAWPLFANVSEIRTVCFNTATANLMQGGASVPHRPEALRAWVANFPQLLADAILTHKGSANDYLMMSEIPMTVGEAQAFFVALVGTSKLSTRAYNVANEGLLAEFNNPSLGTYGKSAADAYNAVTRYYTHNGSAEANAEGGTSDIRKREAKEMLLSDSLAEKLEKGRKALAEYLAK